MKNKILSLALSVILQHVTPITNDKKVITAIQENINAMNWYKKAKNPDADIYDWPELEIVQPEEPSFDLYLNWINQGRKLQGMALKAQELKNLALKAMSEDDIEAFQKYEGLVNDWREEHSERVKIPAGGGGYFEVNLFEDGSMW